jgi:hypothetical protein
MQDKVSPPNRLLHGYTVSDISLYEGKIPLVRKTLKRWSEVYARPSGQVV